MLKHWFEITPNALFFSVGAFVFTFLIGLFLHEVLMAPAYPLVFKGGFDRGSPEELITLGLAIISFVIAGFGYYLLAKGLSRREQLYEQILLFIAFLLILLLGLFALDNLVAQVLRGKAFFQPLGLTAVSVLVFVLIYKRFLGSGPAPGYPILTKTRKAQILIIASAILIASYYEIDTNKDNITRALKTIEEKRQERVTEQARVSSPESEEPEDQNQKITCRDQAGNPGLKICTGMLPIVFKFSYPADWESRKFDDGVFIKNKKGNVGIVLSSSQYPYGFEGGIEFLEEKLVTVEVAGKNYTTEEFINSGGVFADFKIDSLKEMYILFGSGYPVASTTGPGSINDYNEEKDTILEILSSIEFLD